MERQIRPAHWRCVSRPERNRTIPLFQRKVGTGKPLRSTILVSSEKVKALSAEDQDKIRPYFDRVASISTFYFFLDCTTVRKVLGME